MNVDAIRDKFEREIISIYFSHDEVTITAAREAILPLCCFLKENDNHAFDFLSDICGVDRFPEIPRFQVVYHLYSMKYQKRLRVKVPLDEMDAVIDSVVSIWLTANWHERECFDLYGIVFKNHPNLTRILLPEDFEGHPLRKDFPLDGIKIV